MREEGPAALYKGFVPKVLRLAPGGGVLLLVVEFTLEVFRKSSSRFRLYISIRLTFFRINSSWTSLCLSILRGMGSMGMVGTLITHPLLTSVSSDTTPSTSPG